MNNVRCLGVWVVVVVRDLCALAGRVDAWAYIGHKKKCVQSRANGRNLWGGNKKFPFLKNLSLNLEFHLCFEHVLVKYNVRIVSVEMPF